MLKSKYVIDTCALISAFQPYFDENTKPSISNNSIALIHQAFYDNSIQLLFPSTVFIEIYKLFFLSEEIAERIKSEIYIRIKERENMSIIPIDKEVLCNFIKIIDIESDHNFDNHDKQILAVAMMYNCPLITSDNRLIRYNSRKNVIPSILS